MVSTEERQRVLHKTTELIQKSNLAISQAEIANMEIADFGLGEIDISGAQIITLVETDQIAVKIIVMLPGQTEPEHTHPAIGAYKGKEETLRCEWGELYLYSPGEVAQKPKGHPPSHRLETYTVWKEDVLHPGDQVTLPPNTPHWFQGGPAGAVIWSFSTRVVDTEDIFTDSDIVR